MGLAASQCRLLLLTARLHDTEYRAQMISQRRMSLAMQTEQIATEYSRKLNNRKLSFVYDLNSKDNSTQKEPLTYSGLTAVNSNLVGQYRVTLPGGRIAVPSLNDIPNRVIETSEEDGKTYYTEINATQIISALQKYVADAAGEGKDTSAVQELLADPSTWDNETLNKAYSVLKGAGVDLNTEKVELTDDTVFKGSDGEEYVVLPALNNMEFFQNCLRTGSLCVEHNEKAKSTDPDNWTTFDLLHSQFVQDDLYTEDDAAAAAEYESKSAMIQSQDKQLELELKQVETQHQAAQTEYDSVKKIIDKNIERSFKTFG